MAFFENTRKPTGFGRPPHGHHDEHRASGACGLGASLPAAGGECGCAGLWVRRRRESASDAEKVPDGKSVRYRLFSRQRREVAKAQPNRHKRWPLRSAAGKRAGIAV